MLPFWFQVPILQNFGALTKWCQKGGCPGLVVMGGDSCPEGLGFESLHHILDGHFSHIFVVKIVLKD